MAKIAGIEFESKLSLTGVVGFVMLFASIIGFGYTLNNRVTNLEAAHAQEQQDHEQELQMHEKLNETLNDLNYTVGQLKQRMDDSAVGEKQASK